MSTWKRRARTALGMLISIACAVTIALIGPPTALATTLVYSDNAGNNQYFGNWSAPMQSFLHATSEGDLERVEFTNELNAQGQPIDQPLLAVERYTTSFVLKSTSTIDLSLIRPTGLTDNTKLRWGGFFSGADANYVVTGQSNINEDNSLKVVRVTKFTKDWQYVANCEISDINTYVPFDAGSLRMIELDGQLWIRTAHTMYDIGDGLHHQANMTLVIDESTMTLADQDTGISFSDSKYGYASHSFNQFIQTANGKVYTVDHGDAYPRGIMLKQIDGSLQVVHAIAGETGDNYTGVTVGGFEINASGTKSLIAMSVESATNDSSHRHPVIIAVNGSDPATATVKETVIQDYPASVSTTATNPQLIKINDNRFLMVWGEHPIDTRIATSIRYAFLDASGNRIGDIRSANAMLSDCQPIVANGKIVWYASSNSTNPAFYAIDATSGTFSSYQRIISSVTNPEGITVDSDFFIPDDSLPKTVGVTYNDGSSGIANATWTIPDDWNKQLSQHNVTATGKVDGTDKTATLTVTVRAATSTDVKVNGSTDVTTDAGIEPTLPSTATVQYSNGWIYYYLYIDWEANDRYKNPAGGKYDVTGKIDNGGVSTPVTAHVTVKPATVTSVDQPAATRVSQGIKPTIPTTARVHWSSGGTTDEKITWDAGADPTKASFNTVGDFTFTGTAAGKKVTWTVTVTQPQVTKAYDPAPITVPSGTDPTGKLPATVKADLDNNQTGKQMPVTWNAFTAADNATWQGRKGGIITLIGVVNGQPGKTVKQAITVTPATINDVTLDAINTSVGKAPTLPRTATITWSNGETQNNVKVTWDAVDPNSYAQEGTFNATGMVHVDGVTGKVTQPVTVIPVVMRTVTFDSTGGSPIDAVQVEDGLPVAEPTVPTKDGYDFVEWQLNGSTYDFNSPVTGNITLSAVWKQHPVEPGPLARLAGSTRYGTMSAVVQAGFPNGSDTVVVASGEGYADALSASGLAGGLKAPIVLTGGPGLGAEARERIAALGATKAIVIGSQVSVSDQAAAELETMGLTVDRLAGANRYETNLAVYQAGARLGVDWSDKLVVASGEGYADALSASPYAYTKAAPVILSSSAEGLPQASLDALSAGRFHSTLVVGSQVVVPGTVDSMQLPSLDVTPERVSGANRYETSAMVAEWCLGQGMGMSGAVFASGEGFADALSAGPLAGKANSALMLVNGPASPAIAMAGQHAIGVTNAWIVGSTTVVDDGTAQTIANTLGLTIK